MGARVARSRSHPDRLGYRVPAAADAYSAMGTAARLHAAVTRLSAAAVGCPMVADAMGIAAASR